MTDKSYVTLAQRQCFICGKEYDTNELLLDKHLRERFERTTLVGNGICPECQKLNDDGYIALVVIQDPLLGVTNIKMEEAYRTGKIIHLKRSAWEKLFDSPTPDLPMVYIDQELGTKLEELQQSLASS